MGKIEHCEEFEKLLKKSIKSVVEKLKQEYKDIYACSLFVTFDEQETANIWIIANTKEHFLQMKDESPQDTYFYKYCEEEWSVWDAGIKEFEETANLLALMYKPFSDFKVTQEQKEEYQRDIVDVSCECLLQLKRDLVFQSEQGNDLITTIYIRDFFSEEERCEYFAKLNDQETVKEYIAHCSEWC